MDASRKRDRVYKAATVFAAGIFFVPAVFAFARAVFPEYAALSVPLTAAVVLTGFFMQALYAKITGNEPNYYDYRKSLDREYRGFSFGAAVIPVIIAAALSVGVKIFTDRLLYRVFMIGLHGVYDAQSVFPYVSAVVFFLLMCLGIAVWFLPFEAFTEQNMIVVYVMTFIAQYVFSLAGGSETLCAACAFIVLTSFLFVSNKNLLDKRTRGAAVISADAHRFNRILVCVCIAAAAGLFMIIRTVFGALADAASDAGMNIIRTVFREPDKVPKTVPEQRAPSDDVLSWLFFDEADRSFDIAAPIISALLVAAVAAIIVLYRKNLLSGVIKAVKSFFESIASFLSRPYRKRTQNAAVEARRSFRDEVTSLGFETGVGAPGSIKTYAEFSLRLRALRRFEEKLPFAYSMLVYLIRKRSDGAVKPSDSPREMSRKAEAAGIDGIRGITELYETEVYAGRNVGEAERERLLEKICGLVRRYI